MAANTITSSYVTFAIVLIALLVLQAIADWKILAKAGKPGWHSIVPVLNVYSEYDICWSGILGIVYVVAVPVADALKNIQGSMGAGLALAVVMVAGVIHIMQSLKLAKAFGKGTGYGIFLIIFGSIARIILGFGSSEYAGKPERRG